MTGMDAIAMSPKAGAHGELCGMMAIKAAIEARGEGETRRVVLVPDSAHGTNPATAALIGYSVRSIPAGEDGIVSVEAVRSALAPDVAAIMLTNPNTCGLFEREIVGIAERGSRGGGLFLLRRGEFQRHRRQDAARRSRRRRHAHQPAQDVLDPAWRRRPRRGSGRAVVAARALRAGSVRRARGRTRFASSSMRRRRESFGRMCAFHGQMGMFVRALSFILSHGADGLRQASEDAVLSANYIRASLNDLMSAPFGDRACMHEALFDDRWLKDTGLTTLDFAKAMIDEGYHPMTVYFPLIVHGAMLIEPTESESKASLDLFIMTLRDLALAAKAGERERFQAAPVHAPRRRLDETRAARQPVLRWTRPQAGLSVRDAAHSSL